jgi:uncharacterized membrane protein YbjE (DUF340 family)
MSSSLVHREGRGHLVHLLRHLLEMLVAMVIGMFAGGAIFTSALGITVEEAVQDHSVPFAVVMALSMTAPMVAWMRFRGHHWDRSLEMGVAMIAPAIPLCAVGLAGVINGSICGLYCFFSVVAMVGVMVYRRHEYV